MEQSLQQILKSYDASAPLAEAYTIPAPWYTDQRVADLELTNVFARNWQAVSRKDQLTKPGVTSQRRWRTSRWSWCADRMACSAAFTTCAGTTR